MPSTNWTNGSVNSTNFSNTSINSTNFTNGSVNATSWEDDDPSAGSLLLQNGDNLLMENSNPFGLQ